MDKDLANRLNKRFKLLEKWANRQSISCFRIYERDLPDFPFILDWIDSDLICWLYDRSKDEKDEQKENYKNLVIKTIQHVFPNLKERIFLKYRRKKQGLTDQYQKLGKTNCVKTVQEGPLHFEVNLSDYLDIGLFLDHRRTRDYVQLLAKDKYVLNLFAYTGSFTCYAAYGGAKSTTTVDLNANYIEWAKRNLKLNKLANDKKHFFYTENCFQFLKKTISKRNYDLIICDPPTFSNSKKMKDTFNINDDYPKLIKDCLNILSKKGILLFSSNSQKLQLNTAQLPSSISCQEMSFKTRSEDFKGKKGHRCWEIKRLEG